MKKSVSIIALIALLLASFGCGDKATTTTMSHDDTATATTEAAPATTTAATTTPAANSNVWSGEVLETMNSGGYTYLLLDTGSEKIWAAAPATSVAVGQQVSVPKGMMMADFVSKTLDRTFDAIYFVDTIYGAGEPVGGEAASGMGGMGGAPKDANHAGIGGSNSNSLVGDAGVEDVTKLSGGYTIEEVFAQSASLSGKTIKIRGRVVKFTANIMGTNWLHIQDSSKGDLTVTTSATVATGDLVIVEGALTVNKDFGAGYKYDAIIEGASVTKE